ncbi:hypothetical protein, unlikely [Trypanosoma brucei gambiense DAL972]|uniref:Uncharacterized protein n=1 Tax=Trypanosoma brucei gambiense (strain MHOM/CI/86/DAL972) TaxID=679716 RepID=C9ZZE5_TRYB9|nr:hypothetical protein, unlikely [Trypanosoma brucei gambiense DAL972]CBH14794.1 hypothetical protein, unlikely [Trypanosoma brucei gambiense DAL972]|eukprot:XP_011777060.1 hypothetical protein, unlikely [Trypanosoma brucei gambiense DAL972]
MYVCVCVSACFTFISPTIMYFDLSLETKKTNKNKIDRTDRQTCSSSSNSSSRENGKKNKRKKIRKGPNREITAVTARHPRIKHAHTHTHTHIFDYLKKKNIK